MLEAMSNPASLRRHAVENGDQRSTKDDAVTRAYLEAYMHAFAGTEQEFIAEFEAAGIEAWLQEISPSKR
jgi:hypothetical protein